MFSTITCRFCPFPTMIAAVRGSIMSNLTNDIAALQTAIVVDFISLVQESAIFIGSFASMILSAMEADRALSHHRASGFLCD